MDNLNHYKPYTSAPFCETDEIALAVADYNYKQECDFIITIKGHYKNYGLTKEEAEEKIPTDCVWEYMIDNIYNYYETAIIEKSNEKSEKYLKKER